MNDVVIVYFIPCKETISPPAVSGSGNVDSVPQAPPSTDPRDPDKDGGSASSSSSSREDDIFSSKKVDYREYTFKLDGMKLTATPMGGKDILAFEYMLLLLLSM